MTTMVQSLLTWDGCVFLWFLKLMVLGVLLKFPIFQNNNKKVLHNA